MPNQLLEDARFWTTIMKEHALFIKLGLPCDREELIKDADAFFQEFAVLEDRVNQVRRLDEGLIGDLVNAVTSFIAYKRHILRMQVQCDLPASLLPLLIDHITREAEHFLCLLKDCSEPANRFMAVMAREVFWLRIMKEHMEFTVHLLDPSERALIAQARSFVAVFSDLLETARDLQSMAEAKPRSFPRIGRFTDQVQAHTAELRDFKEVAHSLALNCELLSIVSDPLLLDHVRREADKFLAELNELEGIV